MNRNLTVNLPEELIDKLRVRAAVRKESMTAVVRQAIERVVNENDEEKTARHNRLVDRMRNAPDLGLNGKIPWKRADLYDH